MNALRGLIVIDSAYIDIDECELIRDALRERVDVEGLLVDYLLHSREWRRQYEDRTSHLDIAAAKAVYVHTTATGVDVQGLPWFNTFFCVGSPLVHSPSAGILDVALQAKKSVWYLEDTDKDPQQVQKLVYATKDTAGPRWRLI